MAFDLTDRSRWCTLQSGYNAHPDRVVDHLTAGTATAAKARRLGPKPGRPVPRGRRVPYDASGQPAESTVATFVADRYRIVARVSRRALHGWDSPIAPTDPPIPRPVPGR